MPILRVIDIETAGLALPAEIIELGRVDLYRCADRRPRLTGAIGLPVWRAH